MIIEESTKVTLKGKKIEVYMDKPIELLLAAVLEKLEEIRCNQIDIENELQEIKFDARNRG